jgi:hypothetical protein
MKISELDSLAISSASLGKAPKTEVTKKATTRCRSTHPLYGTIFITDISVDIQIIILEQPLLTALARPGGVASTSEQSHRLTRPLKHSAGRQVIIDRRWEQWSDHGVT